MKRQLLALAAVAAALASCNKQDVVDPSEAYAARVGEVSFTAGREAVVRSVPAAGGTVSWTADDKIGVWDGTNYVLATIASVSGSSVTFSAAVDTEASEYIIVSPFDAGKPSGTFSVSGGNVNLALDAVQTAGNQVVSIAKVAKGTSSFTFKNVVSLVRFQVEKAGVVKARFAGNGGEKLAGTLSVNPETGATVSSDLTGTEIEVDVVSGDNFVALPAGVSLSGGFTISLYSDAACTQYEGEVNPTGALALARNQMQNLGELDGHIDNYQLWEHGKAITICGVDYTKAGSGLTATVLTADAEGTDLRQYTHDKTGIFFLQQNEGCWFASVTSAQTQITKDVLLVSRYDAEPVTYKPGRYHQLRKGGTFAIKNVNMDLTGLTEAYFCNFANPGDGGPLKALHVDGCEINLGANKQISYSTGHTLARSIRFYNCFFKSTKAGRTDIFALGANPYLDNVEEVAYVNDIFYDTQSASGAVALFGNGKAAPSSGTPQQTAFILRNCTFYNMAGSNVLFQCSGAKSLTVENNLFYGNSDQSGHTFLITTNVEGDVACTFSGNYSYGPKNTDYTHSNSKFKLTTGNRVEKASTDPLAGADPANGDFTVASAYAGCGAQR